MSKKRLMVLVALGFLLANIGLVSVFDDPEEEILSEEALEMALNEDALELTLNEGEAKSSVIGSYDNTPVTLGFQGSEVVGDIGENTVTTPLADSSTPAPVAETTPVELASNTSTEKDKYLDEVFGLYSNHDTAKAIEETGEQEIIEEVIKAIIEDEPFKEATTFIPPVPLTVEVPPISPAPAQQLAGNIEEVHIYYASDININHTTEELIIRVKANNPIKARTLYVGNPERAILDLEGRWNIAEMPPYPVTNYSTGLRTGYVDNYTRFVIDITTKNFTRKLVQVDPNTVELRVTFEALN